jgi:hypothetical protein
VVVLVVELQDQTTDAQVVLAAVQQEQTARVDRLYQVAQLLLLGKVMQAVLMVHLLLRRIQQAAVVVLGQ